MKIALVFLLLIPVLVDSFQPNRADFDAFGTKIAINDLIFVEARNELGEFLVQFAPFNYSRESLQCEISFDDTAHYVFSVGLGEQQTSKNNISFFFLGKVAPIDGSGVDRSNRNGTFIGVAVNRDPMTIDDYIRLQRSISCNYFTIQQMYFFSAYEHQEYFVMAIFPSGQQVIGFATDFLFSYRPFPSQVVSTRSSTTVWPNNGTFYPCAADTNGQFSIIAGFLLNTGRTRIRATPTVYLMLNSNFTVLSSWNYSATTGSWQSRLTYSDITTWSKKYTMSVKINQLENSTRLLVAMPFLNTVFLFSIGNSATSLQLMNSMENGRSVGFAKSVTWLTADQAAFLVSTYSSDYQTWSSSKIYLYTKFTSTTIPSVPTALIPNAQQPLPSTINGEWIRMVSVSGSLALLDKNGGALIVLSQAAGYFAGTDSDFSPVTASMPVVSYTSPCLSGTYKTEKGIHPCTLCPAGSKNPSMFGATVCINCSSDNFCPLGSVDEFNYARLESVSQATTYPSSPDLDVFEDILLYNMVSFGSDSNCLHVSPMFWILILCAIVIILLGVMASMNLWMNPEKRDLWHDKIKHFFQRTDLVGEGELWLGGLASIAVLLMSAMAYRFAISYMNQYPAEKVGPSTFACDATIRNSKYLSSLQPLAVPVSDSAQPLFTMLDEQNFTMHVEFINTAIRCMSISIFEVIETSSVPLFLQTCSNSNGTLILSFVMSEHDMKIKIVIEENQLIGAVRLGLSGSALSKDLYERKELNFRQAFYSDTSRTLAQTTSIKMEMTKVINETEPLFGSDSEFSGIWYPKFSYSLQDMFITNDIYVMVANLSSISLTIDVSETSYYIKNVQSPIAKQPEIIFRTLLFAFLCLEICAMTFLIFKLILIPLFNNIFKIYQRCRNNKIQPSENSSEECISTK